MDMIGRIRRLHSRKNKSEREISRITGLSRNTVAKSYIPHIATANNSEFPHRRRSRCGGQPR
jgi:hypothetical protein